MGSFFFWRRSGEKVVVPFPFPHLFKLSAITHNRSVRSFRANFPFPRAVNNEIMVRGGEVCPSPSRGPRSPVGDRIAAGPHLPVTVTSNSPYNFTRNKPDKSGTIYLQITLHTPHTHTPDTKKCTACVRYTIFPLFPVEN